MLVGMVRLEHLFLCLGASVVVGLPASLHWCRFGVMLDALYVCQSLVLTLVRSQVAQNRIRLGRKCESWFFEIGENIGSKQKHIRITARAPRATFHPAALCVFHCFPIFPRFSLHVP